MKPLLAITLLLAGLFVVTGCGDDDPVAPAEDPLVDSVTYSSSYLNHRFFLLDLPLIEPGGRDPADQIILESIKIFRLVGAGPPSPGDLFNVATYVDSLGYRNWDSIYFGNPHRFGRRWREISTGAPILDVNGQLVAVDLLTEMAFEDVLAVVYQVRQPDGTIFKVGDIPGLDDPQQSVIGGEGLYYRMKLLKAEVWDREPHTFGYVLRNIYSLGSSNIDRAGFALRIERNDPGSNQPQQDENGLDYLRIFGLDRANAQRTGFPDGQVDVWDPLLIDLARGLLKFPGDFPRPFAPGGNPAGRQAEADMMAEAVYTAYADTAAFVWDPSFLRENQTWQIYDHEVYPWDYARYGIFRIIATYDPHDGDG